MIEMLRKVKQLLTISILIGTFKGEKLYGSYHSVLSKNTNSAAGPLKITRLHIEKPFLIGESAEVINIYLFYILRNKIR